ncbi:MAG: hypothetical protein JJE09_14825 [Bacteroidia bacterium]|nr:hypothetical protein [Bacteroidia bacterium]
MAQRQGVKGQLYWINPIAGSNNDNIPQRGVVREIIVYELATPSDVELEDGFFKKVHTKLISRAFSNRWFIQS